MGMKEWGCEGEVMKEGIGRGQERNRGKAIEGGKDRGKEGDAKEWREERRG